MIKLPSRPPRETDIHYPHTPISLTSFADCLNKSAAVTHSVADHSAYPFANKISLCAGEGSVCNPDPSLIKYLDDPVYGKYFKGKLFLIQKLEDELTELSDMDTRAWEDYRFYHCPCIKTKHELVLHIFHWQKIYKNQINEVKIWLSRTEA